MIFKWLKRQTLISQGWRCERDRRQADPSEWAIFFDCSPIVRILLFLLAWAATMRIAMWRHEFHFYEAAVLSGLFFGAVAPLVALMAHDVWRNNRMLALTLICFTVNFFINKTLFVFWESAAAFAIQAPTDLLIPATFGPMLVTILISDRVGVFLVFLLALADNLFLGAQQQALVSSLLTGLAGVFFARNIRRRSDFLAAGAAVGLVGLACAMLQSGMKGSTILEWTLRGTWAVFLGMATVFVASAILPILEWMFDRVTNISWLELTDLNHPLLKKMTMEAPGTYHHSLVVGNLAESVADSVGANPTMCRVLAYFHDIGKLAKPEYFIENSSVENNPHNTLTPSMSALVIIAHVKEGVDRAIQYSLPKPVVDTIQQHHGTHMVYYFYRKALQQQEAARGDIFKLHKQEADEVQESSFRYPGPIPQFKECAIVSLADAIESGSRNLPDPPTPQSIESLVNDIIKQRIEEGQLDDSQLTLQEIFTLADRFVFALKNMLHSRIEYPKETTR